MAKGLEGGVATRGLSLRGSLGLRERPLERPEASRRKWALGAPTWQALSEHSPL